MVDQNQESVYILTKNDAYLLFALEEMAVILDFNSPCNVQSDF